MPTSNSDTMLGRRRKSLSVFRPNVSTLTPIRDSSSKETSPKEVATLKKKSRTSSIFSSTSNNRPPSPANGAPVEVSSSPQLRPRTLQKSGRPSSIFGSLRSHHSLQDEDENLLRLDAAEDGQEDGGTQLDVERMQVLHHGEVQMAGSMFRKRSQYLLLTNTHLLRFKNQQKASEVFPDIPASMGRPSSIRHSRMSSGGSMPDGLLSVDPQAAISLHNVVAAYKLDDGRPYFTIELAHYDENTNQASTMNMQISDPRDSELWLTTIRAALTKIRLTEQMPFTRRSIEYAARVLEMDSDYDPQHFRMFTVVQRATKSGGRSSSDDLGKLMSNVYYLVIGYHKIHLVPLPKFSRSASSTSLSDATGSSHGLMCLSSVHVQSFDDAFQLGFRVPLQPQQSLYLASASANDIALCIRQAAEVLRPAWVDQPFVWTVPDNLDDALLPVPEPEDEHQGFDRTLTAYCVAYSLDPSNIRYTVNYSCEDAPEFQLYDPANPRRSKYNVLELLAILRALRFNETFHSIAFRGTKLDNLHGAYDRQGSEHFMWSTRSGGAIKLPRLDGTPLIVQEFQCLALKSKRLRKLDLSDTLSRKPRDLAASKDPGSGFCEALFPLCLLNHSNVDWINLNGVALSEQDLEYIYAAAIKRVSHLRAVELARCGLDTDMLRICLEGLSHQTNTLETMNISSNPASIHPDILFKNMAELRHIRRLDLSKVQFESSRDSFISIDLLLKWKLESLTLSGTTLNQQMVDTICTYLVTNQSNTLRELRLEQCQLSGEDAATILHSLQSDRDGPRDLHLFISENRLEKNHSKLTSALRNSVTPTHLTMQMLEYGNERNFADLLSAVADNKSLKYLDISRTSLPYDASVSTCERLKLMFQRNNTLEALNISGEQTHLEAVTLGRGLPDAIHGLEYNTALKVLHIEHQALGLPGASALASALEHNTSLVELYCDNNEISLQAFTTLVNAMDTNNSLLFLPPMVNDRAWSRSKIDKEVTSMLASAAAEAQQANTHANSIANKASGLKKSLVSSGRSLSHRSVTDKTKPEPIIPGFTPQDVRAAVGSLDKSWESQVHRLELYMRRNYAMANNSPLDGEDDGVVSEGSSRPVTAGGLMGALRKAAIDRTPTAELDRQLGSGSFSGNGTDRGLGPEMSMEELYASGSLGLDGMKLGESSPEGFNTPEGGQSPGDDDGTGTEATESPPLDESGLSFGHVGRR